MIGVFDSGIGGLTVVRALRKKLPAARILYVGDVARMPYGNKSAAMVVEYSREIARYLVGRGAKMIVIACNTASAAAADALRAEFSVPILDVISPAVRTALARGRNIAVLGTRGTINSNAYQRLLSSPSPFAKGEGRVRVSALACPMFVPLVEEGYVGTAEGRGIVRRTLKPLLGKKIDTVILGCTHYPLLRAEIKAVLPHADLVDSTSVADDVATLAARDPKIFKDKGGSLEIVVTDRTEHFDKFAEKILRQKIKPRVLDVEALSKFDIRL